MLSLIGWMPTLCRAKIMASQDIGLPKSWHAKMLVRKLGIYFVWCQNIGNQYFSLCKV